MKALIVDDAEKARNLLRLMLAELNEDIEVIAEAENVKDALTKIQAHQPELVFLDIEMPRKSGLQLLEELPPENLNFETIFTTAYNQYAIQAFKLSAVDYLLKPFRKAELQDAVRKAREQTTLKKSAKHLSTLLNNLKTNEHRALSIPLNYGFEYLPLDSIEFIEADGAYSVFYQIDGQKIMVSKNLKHYETILCPLENFAKVNRSYIVNLSFVKSYRKEERGGVILKSGKSIKLSPNHVADFLQKMKGLSH